mgnify:CR=1 FL=1
MVVQNYRLTVQYDGTDFAGFQIQPKQSTIQGEIERALAKLAKEPIRIIGAGRTDAGVHAEGQVISFKSDALTVPVERLPIAINSLLPFSIRVLDANYAPPEFHARYSAVQKTYRYQIFHGPVADVFLRRFSHWIREPLDWELMTEAAQLLVGRHDFQGYAASGSSVKTTVRTLYAIEVDAAPRIKTIRFTADGFLYNMVRNIVGTLIEVGQRKRTVESVLEVLASRNRALAGPTAPPVGLLLERVDYA